MKKLIASIFLILTVGLVTSAQAGFWSDLWSATKAVGKGVAQLSLNVANAITSSVGIHLINESSAFERRLASYTEDSCWFCDVFSNAFDIMNDIVTEMCASLQSTFLTLLGLGLLFWLLFRVGKVVINITSDPDAGLVRDVVMEVMRVSIASLLIIFYFNVFDYAISPLLQFGIGLGNRITGKELTGYRLQATRSGSDNPAKAAVTMAEQGLCPDIATAIQADANASTSGAIKKAFNDVTKESFLCYIRVGSAAMATGMAIGSTAIHAWGDMNVFDKLRHMQLPMIGFIIFMSFFALFIAFPMKLFDPLVNLTFVAAMFPLWVVLWAFPQAGKKYVDSAIGIFTSVIINLIVISIMSVVAINIMNSALGSQAEREAMFEALRSGKRAAAVFEGVGETGWGALLGGFGLVGKATLMTAALGYFAFKLLQKTDKVAGQFKGGIDFGIGKTADAMFSGAGASLVKSGANVVSAGWHAAAPESGDALDSTTKNTRLGKFTRGAMMMGAMGPIGVVAGLRRFNKTPAPVGHTGSGTISDSLRTSRLGNLWNRIRGKDQSWDKFKDKSTGSTYRLDKKTGIATRTDRDGSVVRYDRNSGKFSEADKNGRVLRSYDSNTGKMTFGGKSYVLDNRTNTLVDMEGHAVVDPDIQAEALALKGRSDTNKSDFDTKLRNKGW